MAVGSLFALFFFRRFQSGSRAAICFTSRALLCEPCLYFLKQRPQNTTAPQAGMITALLRSWWQWAPPCFSASA